MELYGIMDPITRDWTDGLFSCIFRDINKPTDKMERRYILFDGDVDALWIENMNSVMDDNKLLTLANGERIRLLDHCALLFEVQKLYIYYSTNSRILVKTLNFELRGLSGSTLAPYLGARRSGVMSEGFFGTLQ
jgi:dynein heavy chain